MTQQKAISDEQVIAALLNSGTIREAAAAVGLSERALYDRMNSGEFQALYKAAKADIVRGAVFALNGNLQAAINTVAEIMNDTAANPATRLQAAQTIINGAAKFTQRLQDTENDLALQVQGNRWGIS